MSFEAEVIPLFIGGAAAVSALELAAGYVLLKHRKRARRFLIGHVICMALALVFLCRSIFANWLGVKVGIASISNSYNIGLFGVLWALSVLFLLSALSAAIKGHGTKME